MAFLTAAGLAVQALRFFGGYDYQLGLLPLFDLSTDVSIPTWYSATALLLCAVLIGVIAVEKRRRGDSFTAHWVILALVFVALSVDEVARIHETLGRTLRLNAPVPTSGFLAYSWVIPGALFTLAFAAAYLKFLLHLPSETKRWFIVAGTTFVGGALGVEMVNAYVADVGPVGFAYHAGTALEECLEMVGIVIFIHALTSYVVTRLGMPHLQLSADPGRHAGLGDR